jgi:hypothetical protein
MFMPHITKETTTQTTKNIGNYEKYIYIYIRKTLRKITKQQKTIVAAEEGEGDEIWRDHALECASAWRANGGAKDSGRKQRGPRTRWG